MSTLVWGRRVLEYKAALNREQLNAFLNPPLTDRDKILEWQEDWQPKNTADVLLYDCMVRYYGSYF